MTEADTVGLCRSCHWMRTVVNRRGSTFYRCGRADWDERFPRYPALPVLECNGYEEAGPNTKRGPNTENGRGERGEVRSD